MFSDKEIITEIKAKGFEAGSIRTLYKDLWLYCKSLQFKCKLTEDEYLTALSDGILDLVDNIYKGNYEGKSKLTSYAYSIIYHKCLDINRFKQTNHIEGDIENTFYQTGESEIPENEIMHEQGIKDIHIEILQEAMDLLTEKCWKVIDARLNKQKHEEIARKFKLATPASARQTFNVCKQKLSKKIIEVSLKRLKESCRKFMIDKLSGVRWEVLVQSYKFNNIKEAEQHFLSCQYELKEYVGFSLKQMEKHFR